MTLYIHYTLISKDFPDVLTFFHGKINRIRTILKNDPDSHCESASSLGQLVNDMVTAAEVVTTFNQ